MQISKEKKAIEYFKNKLKEFKKRLGNKITTEENINLEILLNIIEKQNKELGEKETLYQKALSELVIADKMIDKLAEYIGSNDITEMFCKENVECDEQCKNCVKEFFRKKVE